MLLETALQSVSLSLLLNLLASNDNVFIVISITNTSIYNLDSSSKSIDLPSALY
jgi:hypothetical protein